MPMIDYEKRIDEFLTRAYETGHDRGQAVREYNETFRHEGERKTAFILNKLAEFDAVTQAALGGFVALSIGGSDASDLLAVVSNTPIKRAILLEYDNDAADIARNHTRPQIEAQGGRLEIIVGDAGQQLDTVRSTLEQEKAQGATGLLCLCLAVIHELPRRSPGFDLNRYLARLCAVLPSNLVFLSEPCAPREPDSRLQLKVSTIHEDRLSKLAEHVNAHLFKKEQYKPQKIAHGYVEMEFRLLMETLHKQLRCDAIPRFLHEMGERLTEYSAEDLRRAVLMALPHAAVEVLAKTSEGFRTAYIEASVAIRDAHGQPVPMPFSHVQVSGVSLVRGADSPEAPPQSGDTPAVRQPGRIALRNAGLPGGPQQVAGPSSEDLPEVDEVRKQLRSHSLPFLKVFEQALAAKQRANAIAGDANAVAASARATVIAKRPDYLEIDPVGVSNRAIPFALHQVEVHVVLVSTFRSHEGVRNNLATIHEPDSSSRNALYIHATNGAIAGQATDATARANDVAVPERRPRPPGFQIVVPHGATSPTESLSQQTRRRVAPALVYPMGATFGMDLSGKSSLASARTASECRFAGGRTPRNSGAAVGPRPLDRFRSVLESIPRPR
jgi:hypothetical protein